MSSTGVTLPSLWLQPNNRNWHTLSRDLSRKLMRVVRYCHWHVTGGSWWRENWNSATNRRLFPPHHIRVQKRIRNSRISSRTGSPTRSEAHVAVDAMTSRIWTRAREAARRVSPGSRLCEVAARWLRVHRVPRHWAVIEGLKPTTKNRFTPRHISL